jgi:alpha-L-fucosidase
MNASYPKPRPRKCWLVDKRSRFIPAASFNLSAFTCQLLILSLLLLPGLGFAQGGGDLNPSLKIPQQSLQRWRSLRVGAFIHWSPYVLQGIDDPKSFRAEGFDPNEWVKLFHQAGFKYVVFTTKHGDAICMWDTRETTRNVMNTPMKRDVVGELAAACRKGGIEFCPYYAMENFFHPDFTTDLDPLTGQPQYKDRDKSSSAKSRLDPAAYHLPPDAAPDFERYMKHFKAQMKELTVNYGPFLAWWFDQRTPSWTHARGGDAYAYMRSLQPDSLLSHRIDTCYDRGLDNPTWFVTKGKMAGDYAQSEISIPRFNRETAWEYCRVAGKEGSSWYWKPKDVYRPLEEWLLDVVKSACNDGNFLLGIGAMPNGRFEPRLVDQLRQFGLWLEHYGESIYGTRGGPFKPNLYYGSTCKSNTVYVHVLKTGTNPTLTLPPLPRKVVSQRLLSGAAVSVHQTEAGIAITIGANDIQSPDTIVALELDGSAEEIPPVEESVLTRGASVSASNTRQNKAEYAAGLTVDGNADSYWTTDEGVTEGWLEYDLGHPCTFSRAILDEGDDGWIRHLQIQIKVGAEWKTAFEYQHGNPELWKKIPIELFCPEFRFAPVTAQFVRVRILSATQSPVVREFKLYER